MVDTVTAERAGHEVGDRINLVATGDRSGELLRFLAG